MSLLKEGKHLSVQEMLSKDMRSMATMLGGVSNETLNSYYRSGALASYQMELLEKLTFQFGTKLSRPRRMDRGIAILSTS